MQARAEGKETEPFVRISTRLSESSGRVRLSISDSGTGFPPHILQRAFEPYVTTKARGTGLGLAVVKKIADEHGARIDLSNRIENGELRGAQVSLSFAPETAVVSSSPSAQLLRTVLVHTSGGREVGTGACAWRQRIVASAQPTRAAVQTPAQRSCAESLIVTARQHS